MFSCLGEPCGLPATAFTVSSRYRFNTIAPTRIPAAPGEALGEVLSEVLSGHWAGSRCDNGGGSGRVPGRH